MVLDQVRRAPPKPVAGLPVPEPLVDVCQRAMQMDPWDRYPRADAIADDIDAWIEGSRNRDRALALVEEARAAIPDLRTVQESAARHRERSRGAVLSLRRTDPLEVKEAAWAAEDEAARLQEEVEGRTLEVATRLRLALAQAPGLPEARALLADLYRERAEAAEATGDHKAAQVYRALLAEHDDGRHADYLQAEAPLELVTDPPGATVEILRYTQKSRRLVPQPWATTGPTPIRGMRLPVGSYLLRLTAESHVTLRYPIRIIRTDGWSQTPPGSRSAEPVVMPRPTQVGAGERLVPAGWFVSGGDPEASGALPRQRVWVDAFSMAVRPVTNREYLAFLDDLVKRGRPQRAALHVPRVVPPGMDAAVPAFAFRGGTWTLPERVGEVALLPDAPVVHVTWYDAQAYCLWLGERTGLPWRLPGELEREKAARGVDGRAFPWGDLADPAFHCMQQSALEEPGPPPPDRFPVDESPYGILGLAGGVTEWCADPMRSEGPPRKGSRAITPEPPTRHDTRAHAHDARRVVRGGAWDLPARAVPSRLTHGSCIRPQGGQPGLPPVPQRRGSVAVEPVDGAPRGRSQQPLGGGAAHGLGIALEAMHLGAQVTVLLLEHLDPRLGRQQPLPHVVPPPQSRVASHQRPGRADDHHQQRPVHQRPHQRPGAHARPLARRGVDAAHRRAHGGCRAEPGRPEQRHSAEPPGLLTRQDVDPKSVQAVYQMRPGRAARKFIARRCRLVSRSLTPLRSARLPQTHRHR
jgi:Uncharacterized conserved protein